MWEEADENISDTEDSLAWFSELDNFLSYPLYLVSSVKYSFSCSDAEAKIFHSPD